MAIQDFAQRPRRVVVPEPPKLLLFARGGFAARLQRVAESRPDVELIDMERLHTGA